MKDDVDGLFSGENFSEDERRRLRRLMQDDKSLREMAKSWTSISWLGKWSRIVALWMGSMLAIFVAWKTLKGGTPPLP